MFMFLFSISIGSTPPTPPPTEDFTRACVSEPPMGLSDQITRASERFDVDPLMLLATVIRESGCRPNQVGAAGELGLTQIHPKWWHVELKKEGLISETGDLRIPENNIMSSAYILAKIGRGRSTSKTFERYNGSGPMARKYAKDQMIRLEELQAEFR